MTLRLRPALTVAVAATLAVVVVTFTLFAVVNRFLFLAHLDRLGVAASIVKAQRDFTSGEVHLTRSRGVTGDVEARLEGYGTELARSEAFPDLPLERTPGFYDVAGRPVLVQRVLLGDGAGTLTVTTSTAVLAAPRNAFMQALLVTAPLALVLASLAGWVVSGRLLQPVRMLERAARTIGESADLTRPMPGTAQQDELGRLALALQDSFRAVAAIRRRESDFLRSASHDLRGPLAALNSRVGATLAKPRDASYLEGELREIGKDVARLSRLTNHLLLLARDPSTLTFEEVNLTNLASSAVDRAREGAPDTDLDLRASGSVVVNGDVLLLGQLLENLLSNAARHARGANVLVIVHEDGNDVELTVRDDGPGVSRNVLARLGEPFYRPDAARSGEGSGLGLALARRVAELHGGALIFDSSEGGGFRATATLPKVLSSQRGPARSAERT